MFVLLAFSLIVAGPWIMFSYAIRIYVTRVTDYTATYGALAGAANPSLKTQTSGTRKFRAFSRTPIQPPGSVSSAPVGTSWARY